MFSPSAFWASFKRLSLYFAGCVLFNNDRVWFAVAVMPVTVPSAGILNLISLGSPQVWVGAWFLLSGLTDVLVCLCCWYRNNSWPMQSEFCCLWLFLYWPCFYVSLFFFVFLPVLVSGQPQLKSKTSCPICFFPCKFQNFLSGGPQWVLQFDRYWGKTWVDEESVLLIHLGGEKKYMLKRVFISIKNEPKLSSNQICLWSPTVFSSLFKWVFKQLKLRKYCLWLNIMSFGGLDYKVQSAPWTIVCTLPKHMMVQK